MKKNTAKKTLTDMNNVVESLIEKQASLTDKIKDKSSSKKSSSKKSSSKKSSSKKSSSKKSSSKDKFALVDKKFKVVHSSAHDERVCNIAYSNAYKIVHPHAHKHINRCASACARDCNDKELEALYSYFHDNQHDNLVDNKTKALSKFKIINKLDSKAIMQYRECIIAFKTNNNIKLVRDEAINQFMQAMTAMSSFSTVKQFIKFIHKYN